MATKAQVKLSAKIYFCALVAKMFGHQRNQRRLYETTLIPNMFFDQIGPKVGRPPVPADIGRHGGRPYVSARS